VGPVQKTQFGFLYVCFCLLFSDFGIMRYLGMRFMSRHRAR
jgi:hypothetical protein